MAGVAAGAELLYARDRVSFGRWIAMRVFVSRMLFYYMFLGCLLIGFSTEAICQCQFVECEGPYSKPLVSKPDRAAQKSARSYWNHNGSIMYLEASGNRREFYYYKPREGLIKEGVTPHTLLFSGVVTRNSYEGRAHAFSRRCGTRNYAVSGPVSEDSTQIVMKGSIRKFGEDCEITSEIVEDRLVFDYLYADSEPQGFFGAIAYSPKTRLYTYAIDLPDNDRAKDAALRKCYRLAGDCRVLVSFQNGCGALAIGKDGYGAGWGRSSTVAKDYAITACQKQTPDCVVKRDVCTVR